MVREGEELFLAYGPFYPRQYAVGDGLGAAMACIALDRAPLPSSTTTLPSPPPAPTAHDGSMDAVDGAASEELPGPAQFTLDYLVVERPLLPTQPATSASSTGAHATMSSVGTDTSDGTRDSESGDTDGESEAGPGESTFIFVRPVSPPAPVLRCRVETCFMGLPYHDDTS